MLIILPVGMDYRTRRYPVVTFTLMGICTAVYLISLIAELAGDGESAQVWIFKNLWLIPRESHWWTFLTQMFVHGGFFHLLGNMIFLFLFGACVEDMIGRLHFVLFYLVCGIVAAFAYIMFSPEHFASKIPMGGASGAISACIGGYLVLRAKANIQFKWIFFFYFRVWNGDFQLPAWVVITFWFLKDAANMLLAIAMNHHGGGVAFGAHVGGTLAGMAFMAAERLRFKGSVEPDPAEVFVPKTPIQIAATAAYHARAERERREMAASLQVPASLETATILLFYNGAQSGPFTVSQVQRMFAAHQIPADALYWQEGMTDWSSAEDLREPGVA